MIRRLSGFILCAIFLSIPSHSDAQSGCSWTLYQNTLIYGGTGSNTATSLIACQSLCLTTAQCVGVDWDPTNTGSKCYLQNKKTDKSFNQTGVSHYDYDCDGTPATVTSSSSSGSSSATSPFVSSGPLSTTFPTVLTTASGCSWTLYQNTLIFGGNGSNTATSLAACQSLCISTGQCVGVDWDPTNAGSKCYLQNKKTNKVFNQTGVSHYDYDCNGTVATVTGSGSTLSSSASSTVSSASLSTSFPLVVTTTSGCSWTLYQNTLIFGGNGSNTATSLAACQSLCISTGQCVGVDWDPTNAGSKCYLQNKKTEKVFNQTGVSHYDYDCNGTVATVTGSGSTVSSSTTSTVSSASLSTSFPLVVTTTTGCSWTLYQNTLIFGGNGSNTATSLAACQSLCISTAQCVGVDWDPTNTGSKCYLQNKKTNKVFNQTGVSHYDYDCNGTVATVTSSSSIGCSWTLYQNTLIFGGNGSNTATSLAACQSLCISTGQCVGVDWDPTNAGSKCYLQNKKTNKVFNQTGVSHYDYDCNGTVATVTGSGASSPSGPSSPPTPPSPPPPTIPPSPACRVNFEYAYNTTSVGGLFIPEITSQLQCFDSCVTITDCLGFDLSGPDYSLCWLYFDPENFRQKYFKLNVFQYSINRCPEQDIGRCIPTYDTNNVLNDSCSAVCYPEWRRYDNYAGSSTAPWQEKQPWKFNECLSTCVATPGCIGIELRNQPGIPSACRYYGSGDRNALTNLTLTAFVTQYSIVNTCIKKCNATWEKLSQTSIRLTNPTPKPNIATEGDCLKACRIDSSCLVAQWRIGVDPGCTLADAYIPNTRIPNGAAVTYVYRESCPEPPPLPTPPADRNSSTTTRNDVGGSSTGSPATGSTTACWVLTRNTNFLQGVVNSAPNVSQCQTACQVQTSPKCIAVDWDNAQPNGSKCFLNSIAQNKSSSPGVDHYDFVCTNSATTGGIMSSVSGSNTGLPSTGITISSSGSSSASSSSTNSRPSTTVFQLPSTTPSTSCWVQMNDTLIDQGVGYNATGVPQCQAACQAQTSPSKCLSVDWDNTKLSGIKCFLHSTSQGKRPAPGVDHYDFIC